MWKYCSSISQLSFLILYIIFPFFHPYCFFSLVFSSPHTYTHSYLYPPFFLLLLFLFLLDSKTSLSLSFSNSLFFFFYLISKHSLALSVIRNGERGREKEQVRDLACSTVDRRTQAGGESAFTVPSRAFRSAAACLPPQRSPNGSNGLCLFSLFFSLFVLLLWFD